MRSSSRVASLLIAFLDRLRSHIIEALEINQSIAMVLACEAFKLGALMLGHTTFKVVAHAELKGARSAADNVSPILLIHHSHTLSS